jgi:hypothetical protein
MKTSILQNAHEMARYIPSGPISGVADIDSRLRLFDDGEFSVYYAPFEPTNDRAKIVIIGITPGFTQARESYAKYSEAVRRGMTHDEAARVAKGAASFAGSMRTNLVSMLDEIGVPEALGLRSSEQLFSSHANLLHATSALRYPVFKNGANYAGNPSPTKHPALLKMIETVLGPELSSIHEAIYIPLGKAATIAIDHLAGSGRLDRSRSLIGFPHPSGANGHRKKQFEKNRDDLSDQVKRALST